MKKKITVFLLLFFCLKNVSSQSYSNYLFALDDYLNKCYSDSRLILNGNYFIIQNEISRVPKNYFLFIRHEEFIDTNRNKAISDFTNKKIINVKINTTKLFEKLVNSKKFDTSYLAIKSKTVHCAGGISIRGVYKSISPEKNIYFLVLKFNSKHPSRQAEFLIEYKFLNNKWKFVSEQMTSIN